MLSGDFGLGILTLGVLLLVGVAVVILGGILVVGRLPRGRARSAEAAPSGPVGRRRGGTAASCGRLAASYARPA